MRTISLRHSSGSSARTARITCSPTIRPHGGATASSIRSKSAPRDQASRFAHGGLCHLAQYERKIPARWEQGYLASTADSAQQRRAGHGIENAALCGAVHRDGANTSVVMGLSSFRAQSSDSVTASASNWRLSPWTRRASARRHRFHVQASRGLESAKSDDRDPFLEAPESAARALPLPRRRTRYREGVVGTVNYDMELPAFSELPLSMSGLLVTSRAATATVTARGDPELQKFMKLPPAGPGTFPKPTTCLS